MGRRKDPAALQELKGNPGKRPIAKASGALPLTGGAAGPGEAPKGPAVLPPKVLTTAAEKAVWNRLAPLLQQLRFVKDSDHDMLARYCYHAAEFWRMRKIVKRDGEFYETTSPHVTKLLMHPAVRIMERHERWLDRYEDKVGLNPRARNQLMIHLSSLGGLLAPGLQNREDKSDQPAAPTRPASPVAAVPRTRPPGSNALN